ncbi:DUF1643 domain-containing protein, partial [Candidatus Pacearchaeota archaeon]|nr:DUF1643 domain-containing protein [Candidatus Pacearchaeota archaeon]
LRKLDNIVMAWGTKGNLYHRDDVVYKLIMSSQLYTLGLTRGGFPRHPLYVPKDRNLVNLNGKMN